MISLQLWISVGSKNQPSSKVLLWISLDMGRHRYRPTQLWQLWMLAGQREYQQNNCCEMSLLLTFCKLIPSTQLIRIWYYTILILYIRVWTNLTKTRGFCIKIHQNHGPHGWLEVVETDLQLFLRNQNGSRVLGSQLLTSQICKWRYLSRILPWLLPMIGYNGAEWWN